MKPHVGFSNTLYTIVGLLVIMLTVVLIGFAIAACIWLGSVTVWWVGWGTASLVILTTLIQVSVFFIAAVAVSK